MIDIQHLQFSYQGKSLYQDFSLHFARGKVYGLLGKNGSGKTTLLNLISGTLFGQKGDIVTLEQNPKQRNPRLLADIFYLPEQFRLPALSADDYLSLYQPFYPNFNQDDFMEYSQALEVESSSKLSKLSMGQQKKFLLAFGLACHCRLNLLDEPTNGLDIPSKQTFRKVIAASATDDKTFIISTHQVKDVETLIDQVCLIDNGNVALNRSTELLSNKLEMQVVETLTGAELFSKSMGLGRFAVVNANQRSTPTHLDLELLFNATLANQEGINQACESLQGTY